MTPTLIAAIGAAAAVVVSAIFTGLAQLQHNRNYHGPTSADSSPADGSPSPQQRP